MNAALPARRYNARFTLQDLAMRHHLIVQAPNDPAPHLDTLVRLSRASRIETLVPGQAYRLCDVHTDSRLEINAFCEAYPVDCAFIEDGRRWEDFRLLVSDMDSTLIAIECIDEIADMQGIKPQVAAITARSMAGELDFTASLRERVALLEGLPLSALEQVYRERLKLMPGARELVRACRDAGIRTLLISGGFTFFTDRLRDELGLDHAVANELEVVNGHLTGRLLGDVIDAQAKADWLVRLRDEMGLAPCQTIAMGDGANDLKMLAVAGLGVGMHPKPVVRQHADVSLRYVGLDGLPRLFAPAVS